MDMYQKREMSKNKKMDENKGKIIQWEMET